MFKSTNNDIPISIQWIDDLEVLVKSNQNKTVDSFKAKFESVKNQIVGITQGKINPENFNNFISNRQESVRTSNQKYKSKY